MRPHQDFEKILHSVQEKATPVRLKLLELLSRERYPLSIKEIGKKITSYDQSTLYRTLQTLVMKKLVREILLDKTTARFEILIGRNHHHHIICTDCGFIEDIHGCPNIITKKFADITGHNLEFFGICKSCVKK
jgi:Fe2+ or Zn2+ uptake regulation protein